MPRKRIITSGGAPNRLAGALAGAAVAVAALAAAGVAVLGACNPAGPTAASRVVWTDGSFDDWEGVAATVVDAVGDVLEGSPVDLGAITVQDDPRFLHFLIDLGDTVTVQGMRGSVELVLDADGDSGTGGSYGGVDGADLAVILTRQSDPAADRHGAGVGVRRIGPGGAGEVEPASLAGLLVSPTHSSDRFEVRLDRTAVAEAIGQRQAVGPGNTVAGRLRYLRAGALVDETPVFSHELATAPGEEPPLLGAAAVAKAPGAFRVVVWNVSDQSFRANADAFQRVVAALNPDVLLLDEVYYTVTLEDLERFGDGTSSREGEGPWNWSLAQGGGRQRTAVGARGLAIRGEPEMARIDHAPGALDQWLAEVGDEPEAPRMPPPSVLARAEAAGGLSATGAWVTIEGVDVLFVPVDLQSAGYDGSPRDRLREFQAATLNGAIAAALAERPDAGVVVAGDLNLVGSARPLDALRRGLGADGNDLEVARPERLRDRSLATWRSTWGNDPFSPGRLDYLMYRGGVLKVDRAFVFDAADMSPVAREALAFLESDTEKSDHLPLVVDLRVR